MDLPESYNTQNDINDDDSYSKQSADNSYEAFLDVIPEDNTVSEREELDVNNSQVVQEKEFLVRFKNAVFSWKMKENVWLEVDDLEIPAGKPFYWIYLFKFLLVLW